MFGWRKDTGVGGKGEQEKREPIEELKVILASCFSVAKKPEDRTVNG